MPSISSFLKRSKARAEKQNHDSLGSADTSPVVNNGAGEKAQRRHSKRDFIRNLLSPKSTRSESRASNRYSSDKKVPESEPPKAPMPNSNKPLPAPPVTPAAQSDPAPKSPIKSNRIIKPISIPELHELFSGAPQFFVRSEGQYTGPPKPSTAFPWNTEVSIRDLCDHCQNDDEAWASVTAYPHITRDVGSNNAALQEHKEKQRARYMPICHERPNMLSSQGLERGTSGFSAALEIGVADSLYEEKQLPASAGMGSISDRQSKFLSEKRGVRPLAEPDVVMKLMSVGDSYHNSTQPLEKSSVDWYTDLFTQVLFPPTRVTDSNDPYSLHVQIEALIDVLATPYIWIDFGLVEWRIRLGQILWGAPHEPESAIGTPVDIEIHDSGVPAVQKFWLLLQILLSCELLIRLDFVTKKAERNPNTITAEEVRRFEEHAKPNVRWSLILARIWLDNIRIGISQPPSGPEEKKVTGGWLAALTGTSAAAPTKEASLGTISTTEFHSRHESRQINGLLHFARKLHWPDADAVAEKFTQNSTLIAESKIGTPVAGTPFSMATQRSSYFGNPARSVVKRETYKQQNRRFVMVQALGWLSRSYLTGLILPGEVLSHLLISTLLENDESAVSRLGDEASLYGGFKYASQSYWSTTCVIGRILAARKGASECMGWLSSDVLPEGLEDTWVNIEVEIAPQNEGDCDPGTARIWKKHSIERDGHVLGDGDASTALPGDFTLPTDDTCDTDHLDVTLKTLELVAINESVQDTPATSTPVTTPTTETPLTTDSRVIKNYSAKMKFTVNPVDGESRDLTFDILYDVRFVTAHPCVPSHHTSILDSPTSPSSELRKPSTPVDDSRQGPHEHPLTISGHPLHKSFTYKREVISKLLLHPPPTSSTPSPLASLHTSSQEILVVDCHEPDPPMHHGHHHDPLTDGQQPSSPSPETSIATRRRRFGSDLEVLARVWCAERGYHALISRRGRNCLACSIREARALGWRVVLRFG